MIPTAILAGLLLGLIVRWWAIPVVAVGWAIVAMIAADASFVGAALLGAANAFVGAAVAIGFRALTRASSHT